MRIWKGIVGVLLLFGGSLFSQQNLIPNGDMDQFAPCVYQGPVDHWSWPPWIPDFTMLDWNQEYNSDHTVKDTCTYESFFVSDTLGRNSSGCIGFLTYAELFGNINYPNYRYFPQAQLSEPMIKGKRYYFEFYVKFFSDTLTGRKYYGSYFNTDHIGVAFTSIPPNFRWNSNNPLPVAAPFYTFDQVVVDQWTKISGCYTSTGGERYLMIGNFALDAVTTIRPNEVGVQKQSFANSAVYLLDDVFLTSFDPLGNDTTICAAEKLTLDATFPAKYEPRYRWSTGEITPQISVNTTGKYKVDVILGSGCALTDSIFVTAIPDPRRFNREVDTTFCEGIPLQLAVGAGIPDAVISWNDGSTNRERTIGTEGTYSAAVSLRCGSWTETYHVQSSDCKIFVFFPNAFTPNGDGLNESFFPVFDRELIRIRNWNLEIYDRWGELIFQSDDPDKQWDGLKYGKAAQEGIYVWRLVYEGQKNNGVSIEELNGTVLLMR